ncbi:ADP-ribosylglycohydrolase family protein [Shewanella sp. 202IG2-18]|uniref:ADP-ribosylglycohydrolase family protein n=1 Tax=Parashewanella hymeniacidonis TaxID=2807618 RepID=UPI00196146FA|nr:ADP-ribosylglycohydrolase family protein [Parashewanella hymeniacidonis]MBM7073501.1 ADP-ribosylglycohydrolase family protein [Parashewanella hymeniacidonis]
MPDFEKQKHITSTAVAALQGLALGDALGTTLEFKPRGSFTPISDIVGGGPFKLEAGQWTDDTSMMLCLADSLIECDGHNADDEIKRYLDWHQNGSNSCTGECFDIGNTVAAALNKFKKTNKALAGSNDEYSAGNGSLMRIAPVALFYHQSSIEYACEIAAISSQTTHAEPRCIDACRFMAYLLHKIINKQNASSKEQLLTFTKPSNEFSDFHPDITKVVKGSYKHKAQSEIKGSGFVVESLEAALWCFYHSENFKEGALLAANLGDDADTTAAIYGQLAGAFYGSDALPREWLDKLAWRHDIELRALTLVLRSNNKHIAHLLEQIKNIKDSHQLYENINVDELMLTGLDWSSWLHHSNCFSKQNLSTADFNLASISDCLGWLTALVRSERFNSGAIDESINNGTMQKWNEYFSTLVTLNYNQEVDRRKVEPKSKQYIFVGDIHGQINKLNELLEHHGYDANDQSDDIHFIFIGDLIDNQQKANIDQIATLNQVKSMVEDGHATCLMGNHEINAIGWMMEHPEFKQPLRPHSSNNLKQHQAFLNQVNENSVEHEYWVDWFKSLPLFVDFGEFRAIHACWNEDALLKLQRYTDGHNRLLPKFWINAFDKEHELFGLIETVLKGPEITLPESFSFTDKTGIERTRIRIRWWQSEAKTYRDIAQVQPEMINEIPLLPIDGYQLNRIIVPTFIGHYTLNNVPNVLSEKVACVDYNAAKGDNPLVSYIWNKGDKRVFNKQFEYVKTGNPESNDENLIEQGIEELIHSRLQQLELDYRKLKSSNALEDFINQKLWNDWDPIGVNGIEECGDEYHFLIEDIFKLTI